MCSSPKQAIERSEVINDRGHVADIVHLDQKSPSRLIDFASKGDQLIVPGGKRLRRLVPIGPQRSDLKSLASPSLEVRPMVSDPLPGEFSLHREWRGRWAR